MKIKDLTVFHLSLSLFSSFPTFFTVKFLNTTNGLQQITNPNNVFLSIYFV